MDAGFALLNGQHASLAQFSLASPHRSFQDGSGTIGTTELASWQVLEKKHLAEPTTNQPTQCAIIATGHQN